MADNKSSSKPKQTKKKVLDPFKSGVYYKDFVDSLKGRSVKDALKDTHTTEQINWIEIEVEHFKNNK